MRPDIVWFGEALPPAAWQRAAAAVALADTVLVIGTSGLVNPAASLVARYPHGNACVIEINPETTDLEAANVECLASGVAPRCGGVSTIKLRIVCQPGSVA